MDVLGIEWDTSQLRRRQEAGDVGPGSGQGRRTWALVLAPVALMVLGFLVLLTPATQVGALLVILGTFVTPIVGLSVWRGR